MQNYSNTDWVSFQEVVTNLVFSMVHVHLCVCVSVEDISARGTGTGTGHGHSRATFV